MKVKAAATTADYHGAGLHFIRCFPGELDDGVTLILRVTVLTAAAILCLSLEIFCLALLVFLMPYSYLPKRSC